MQKKGLDISARSFLTSILVIFVLMILTYALTFMIPAGEYARTVNAAGDTVIDTASGFSACEGGIPFWKWLLSPVLQLGAEGSGTTIAVIAFLLVIGGVFNALDKCGLMQYMLRRIVSRFGTRRYTLMAVVMFFFMALGAIIGSFEECVPLVPIVVALAVSLGWDALTGICMSLLAVGCGFSSGVCNPFTVGVAQELAGLPMFSGLWLRALCFIPIYLLLFAFVRFHAKRVEQPLSAAVTQAVETEPQLARGLKCFGIVFGIGILTVLCSSFVTALQDYTMIIVALTFLIAGIAASLLSGMKRSALGSTFFHGVVSILPAVAMILMASSIRYTLTEAKVLDSILHGAVQFAGTLPKWSVVLFIYLLVLVLNFFIASGSAKAFLLIPLIVPVAQLYGISPQLCILAFAFGDGFSNVIYPTNPVLLISLGLAGVSYGSWLRRTWFFQLLNLLLTAALLLLALAIGYQ